MNPSPRPVLLRPRELVVTLFARALDGDERAFDDLRTLAPDDERAAAALGAVVVTEIDTRFHADPDGHGLPTGSPTGVAGALAAINQASELIAKATEWRQLLEGGRGEAAGGVTRGAGGVRRSGGALRDGARPEGAPVVEEITDTTTR